MCKRNFPHKKGSMGRVRETPHIKMKPAQDLSENLPRFKKKKKEEERSQHGMCKRNSLDKKESQHGMCKRYSPNKNEASIGCVRETPHIKMKPARDV